MKRREFLKTCGAVAAGSALTGPLAAAAQAAPAAAAPAVPASAAPAEIPAEELLKEWNGINLSPLPLTPPAGRQVTVVIIGAGNRGSAYARFSEFYPDAVKVVGVSDINPFRQKRMADKYNIPADHVFGDFHEVFEKPKMADCVVVATPDRLHFEPAMKAMALGYHVLLEKPVAPTERECRALIRQSKKYNRIVGVCHVLRYAPYFVALKKIIDAGAIGQLVSIQHQEPIEYAHMAHAYVRGNWRSSKETTPIILAKSCHDLDILRWIVGKPCKTISAEGSLHLFKEEMAPKGAPKRCTDGCPYEETCPYSAIDVYVRRKRHTYVFDIPAEDRKNDAVLMEQIKNTQYGRCVYYCDNDQPDHYVSDMLFEGGVTASFTMDAFTPWGGRRSRFMGTEGYIEGDMKSFKLIRFRDRKPLVWNAKVIEVADYKNSGHGGGDYALMRDFVAAVSHEDPSYLSSPLDESLESHLMGFAAEKSRKGARKGKVRL